MWDIASAYPAAMVTLPCLRHGEWRHHKRVRRLGTLSDATMVYVRWDAWPSKLRPRPAALPLPGRRPHPTALREGWYWIEEVRAAINYRGVDSFEVVDAWEWVQSCEHRPFDWIPELYEQRQRLGKNTAGMVLKYGMNSLYGKMAQTIGGGGRYTEFVWAGDDHGADPCQIARHRRRAGPDAVMFATDGVGSPRDPPELERVAQMLAAYHLVNGSTHPSAVVCDRTCSWCRTGSRIESPTLSRFRWTIGCPTERPRPWYRRPRARSNEWTRSTVCGLPIPWR